MGHSCQVPPTPPPPTCPPTPEIRAACGPTPPTVTFQRFGEGTVAGTRANGEVAATAVIRGTAIRPLGRARETTRLASANCENGLREADRGARQGIRYELLPGKSVRSSSRCGDAAGCCRRRPLSKWFLRKWLFRSDRMPRQPLPKNHRKSGYDIASLGMERRPQLATKGAGHRRWE
jgi:hypothetical protein